MKITKGQLKRIINETRRTLEDNPYAFEGDDVGPGEIPASYQAKLYSALVPLGFEIFQTDSKYLEYDIIDPLTKVEAGLRKQGFKNPQAIIDHLEPMLIDIIKSKSSGGYRTQALVDAITYDVFDQAAGGRPFAGDPAPTFSRQPIWNEEEDPAPRGGYGATSKQFKPKPVDDGRAPMISDSYNRKNKMKISKRQLKRIIKEEYSKLKRQGLIRESLDDRMADMKARRPMSSMHMNMAPDYGQGDAYEEEMAGGGHMPNGTILDLASEPGGVDIEELIAMFGEEVFEKIDELEADGLLKMMDDGMVVSMRGY